MPATSSVDAATAIDQAPFGRAQKRIVFLCALIAMLDGFDTQVVAFVAPVLAARWGVPVSSFGPVFGAGLAGLMLGALVFGPAADRFGRRRVIMATTAIFGLFTLLTPWADSPATLLILRLLTGLGLGGAMPNIIALTAEYAPARSRATLISLMFCGFPLGAVLGGFLAARMIPSLGWESTFWLGGALPLLLLPALFVWLPESIRLLAARRTPDATLRALLVPILGAERAAQVHFKRSETQPQQGMSVMQLFGGQRTAQTLLLWAVFFMNLLVLYFLVNWLPALLRQAGVPLDKAIVSTALLNLGGIAGALMFARLIDRLGPYRVLLAAYVAAGLATFAIGRMTQAEFPALMAMVFVAGFCVIGAQISINALASGLYPTEIRSTGVGWALGVGRAGSIVGPVVGGMLVGTGVALESLFAVAALPAWTAAVAVALLARATMRRREAVPGADARPAAGAFE
ncbi:MULTISPECIES: MFS transporter [unclassified Variovorax]|uniref:MFS transporter n=1 Tax=unclassified Variovorax TaxID=663243 RepID=UPI00076DDCBB|nr:MULTISPECIES: MFS transporter [unclassified Variovorax]KWT83552.1 4-hydroxybenzoate transporter [Variovorax sp. WDL1]PNG59596.1 3-hydroxybenzoate transporter MhbT [Variovorax sp. B4]PNG60613.1 3-hydroxybenzoate transporter MhbT [Variovorax sp. B2]VTV13493.1 4-hydroxybenzoate transporter PcaK [Variovorax sp. WDL1]